jgi:hypothetical protein
MDERERDSDLIDDDERRPDFARGQAEEPDAPGGEPRGHFGRGRTDKGLVVDDRRGDFAEGQATDQRPEQVEDFGRFARGQDEEPG